VRAGERLIGQDVEMLTMCRILFAHLRHRCCVMKKYRDVRADHHFKILRRIFREWLGNIDARAVGEQIDTAEMPDGGLRNFYRRIFLLMSPSTGTRFPEAFNSFDLLIVREVPTTGSRAPAGPGLCPGQCRSMRQ
jgi:hypothetical protein